MQFYSIKCLLSIENFIIVFDHRSGTLPWHSAYRFEPLRADVGKRFVEDAGTHQDSQAQRVHFIFLHGSNAGRKANIRD